MTVTIQQRKALYEGWVKLGDYEIDVPALADPRKRRRLNREVVDSNETVVVLIYAPEADSFVMAGEYRAGIIVNNQRQGRSDEPLVTACPAGFIDDGETPEAAARREVQEETGLNCEELIPISGVYSSPGFLSEKTWIYYTEVPGVPETGLHGAEDENEDVRSCLLKKQEAYDLLARGLILDAKTVLALYWFKARRLLQT